MNISFSLDKSSTSLFIIRSRVSCITNSSILVIILVWISSISNLVFFIHYILWILVSWSWVFLLKVFSITILNSFELDINIVVLNLFSVNIIANGWFYSILRIKVVSWKLNLNKIFAIWTLHPLWNSQEGLQFNVWFLLSNLLQKVSKLRFRNCTRLSDIKVHKEIIKIEVMEFKSDTNL